MDSLPIGPGQKRVFSVQISKNEYTDGKQEFELDDYRIYVYSLEMLLLEKLRALCQQMKEYEFSSHPTARARDFYDIHLVLTRTGTDLSTEENADLLRQIFAAKKVPVRLLELLPRYRDFHRQDWAAVVNTVPDDLPDYNFHFDFVVQQNVQKPISTDVIEGQSMVAAARKYKRVVQVGVQRRSAPHLIEARNRVKDGMLGKISHAEVCCYVYRGARGNPPDIDPPPHLDYEMWTGPAPMRPFCHWTHPRRWRYFMEYGNGVIGDMCIHMLDLVRWTLDLGWPKEIYSTGGIFVDKDSKANTPDTQTATFAFPDLNVIWTHRNWGRPADPDYPWAYFIHGEKGVLKGDTRKWEFFPVDPKEKPLRRAAHTEMWKYDIDNIDTVESRLPRGEFPVLRAHMKDFLNAIDERSRPVADIEQGHISSASCILANISLELGRSLRWDPVKHEVIGDKEATAKLARKYRKPWVHPTPKTV